MLVIHYNVVTTEWISCRKLELAIPHGTELGANKNNNNNLQYI